MKIYCLIENTKSSDLFACEHGLSLFIDTGSLKILFDMGSSDAFIENAKKLDLDLSEVDVAIISHGHYDHGGGLKSFLEINKKAKVYISKSAFEPHYNGQGKYIGLDTSVTYSDRIILTDGIVNIDTGVTVFNCNHLKPKYEIECFGQTALKNGEYINEDYKHEQYLMIEENGKRALFSGCSHRGILNIVNWIEADYIVGGFHFSKMELNKELECRACYLNTVKSRFITCHCTGEKQFEFMKKYAKNIECIRSGEIMEI